MFRVTEDDGGNQTDERANAPTRSTARRIGFWFGVGLILAGLSMVAYVGWQLYGTNWVAKKHQKPTRSTMQGGIIDKDMPLPAANVAVLCSKDGPTRVG